MCECVCRGAEILETVETVETVCPRARVRVCA